MVLLGNLIFDNEPDFLNISGMPSLNMVCVRVLPFPPSGTTVVDSESPNVEHSTTCSPDIQEERPGTDGIRIYPNPAVETLYIGYFGTGSYSFSICDIRVRSLIPA